MTQEKSRADWQRLAAGLKYATGHFIDGEHVAGRGALRRRESRERRARPCAVSSGTAADIDIAVASGRRAFAAGGWRYMAPRDRSRC